MRKLVTREGIDVRLFALLLLICGGLVGAVILLLLR
jgi:hypothetical protein